MNHRRRCWAATGLLLLFPALFLACASTSASGLTITGMELRNYAAGTAPLSSGEAGLFGTLIIFYAGKEAPDISFSGNSSIAFSSPEEGYGIFTSTTTGAVHAVVCVATPGAHRITVTLATQSGTGQRATKTAVLSFPPAE